MKTVFLDRDGVINRLRQGDYVKSWSEFEFLPTAIPAIRCLSQAGCRLIIVTNQAGVSKGIVSPEVLETIHQKMVIEIENGGGRIDAMYYCPHRDEDNCRCRKPKPGLLEQAIREHTVDPISRFLVGDSLRDIVAGQAVGCKTCLVADSQEKGLDPGFHRNRAARSTRSSLSRGLVSTIGESPLSAEDTGPDQIVPDLVAAASWIISTLDRLGESGNRGNTHKPE